MALVVTARSPVEASAAELSHTAVHHGRSPAALVALPVGAAFACWLSIVADSAARATGSVPWLDAAARATGSIPWLETAALAIGAVGALLVCAACAASWLWCRNDAGLLLAATVAPVAATIRAIASPLLTSLDLTTLADAVDFALGWVVLGALVWAAAGWLRQSVAARVGAPQTELFRRVAEVTALVVLAVGLSGAMVRAVGASWACTGAFPDCNGLGVMPFGRDPLADIQLYHRLLSYVALGLVLWLTIEAFRTQRTVSGLGSASLALVAATVLDAVLGAVSVSLSNPPAGEVAHTAASAATWSAAIVLVFVAHRAGGGISQGTEGPLGPSESLLRAEPRRWPVMAYVQLTKPRVMSLLLATTASAMVIAARGMPDLGTLIATLVGGALMSGGAGAINHYVDRDIDPLMGRTAWRPIPSGVISPRDALLFGIALAAIASAVFIFFVNPLACLLALIGLLGYVFIYTLWLKRSTPSNIVIGGAAGAIPPLVGWAAVTNEISSLTAWYLFAIIFFWTPPHFWALSLLIRKHYERAGVPMLPVVRGEDETRRQIVLYSVLLIALTLVLSPFGMMGRIYFVAAAVLGAVFIFNAVRLWQRATPGAARRLYLYSMLYLFALFAAMAVDRVLA